MDDDLKAVVERVERRAQDALGFYSFETGREIYVPIADLRALLSALRQRDEALRRIRLQAEDCLGVRAENITNICDAILTESETNAR